MISARLPTCVSLRGTWEVKVEWTILTAPIYKSRWGARAINHVHPHSAPLWDPVGIDAPMVVRPLVWLCHSEMLEPAQSSRHSDWLWTGTAERGQNSSARRVNNFLFSTSFRPSLGPIQPPIQCVPGALSPGVKWLGLESDHSSPTSAEVKKTWIYTSTSPYVCMAYCLIS
jgi:hypothetical protein